MQKKYLAVSTWYSHNIIEEVWSIYKRQLSPNIHNKQNILGAQKIKIFVLSFVSWKWVSEWLNLTAFLGTSDSI